MSPRAACRLVTFGFGAVYDYVPGKTDWLARGQPTEGELAGQLRAHHVAVSDVVLVRPNANVADVRAAVEGSGFPFAVVSSDDGVVLGRLPLSELAAAPDERTADAVMRPGPSTVRADVSASALLDRLRERDLQFAIVTTPEGRFAGVVARGRLEDALKAQGRP